tara:strand:- start:9471 stop:9674 length:204 start_codon:yes stop_codon:yes gene_type:complete
MKNLLIKISILFFIKLKKSIQTMDYKAGKLSRDIERKRSDFAVYHIEKISLTIRKLAESIQAAEGAK